MLPSPGQYVNLHAHRASHFPGEWVITSLMAREYPPVHGAGNYYSVGLHPWELAGADAGQLIRKLQLSMKDERVIALGEAGLDRSIDTPLELQSEIFKKQVKLAELSGRPMILHVVRAFNEILDFIRTDAPAVPMVIHGFRGKQQWADLLLGAGCYLSFGEHFLKSRSLQETVAGVAGERIFLETDTSEIDIRRLYRFAAELRHVPEKDFRNRVLQNTLDILGRKI